ncbi:DarT ssDNA thymidine ADP-ribosyltransferase family protein [Streptomyces sp. CC208A]|uniref:DarT ssDNA thymidine ADP-ribosyltransferase family protein n=1 Tax=Streptomyces sp. CC208A TaxID=3044573 RepID=UPI0024A8043E|nr:DarT ssDNA thymidine ADP-ribosyltransferase family protein [Streptomyces sp. CC208A]
MSDIVARARARGVTRLCHCTKSTNLSHILDSREIRPVSTLREAADAYRPADTQRLDGAPDRTFLSVEYPNAWYQSQAAGRDPHFSDWVVLTVDVELLGAPGTRFSPYNSARDSSAGALPGADAFDALFAPTVTGNTTRRRHHAHPAWWPTDDQAEIQVPGTIPLSAVRSVIVRDEQQADLEYFRLMQFGMAALLPPLTVAPVLFDRYALSTSVRSGRRPPETPYIPRATLAE